MQKPTIEQNKSTIQDKILKTHNALRYDSLTGIQQGTTIYSIFKRITWIFKLFKTYIWLFLIVSIVRTFLQWHHNWMSICMCKHIIVRELGLEFTDASSRWKKTFAVHRCHWGRDYHIVRNMTGVCWTLSGKQFSAFIDFLSLLTFLQITLRGATCF